MTGTTAATENCASTLILVRLYPPCLLLVMQLRMNNANQLDSAPERKNFFIGNRDLHAVDEVVRHDLKLKLPEIYAAWKAH